MALRRLCLGALQQIQHTWQLTGTPAPQLALAGAFQAQQPLPSLTDAIQDMLGSSLWLAVPKQKVRTYCDGLCLDVLAGEAPTLPACCRCRTARNGSGQHQISSNLCRWSHSASKRGNTGTLQADKPCLATQPGSAACLYIDSQLSGHADFVGRSSNSTNCRTSAQCQSALVGEVPPALLKTDPGNSLHLQSPTTPTRVPAPPARTGCYRMTHPDTETCNQSQNLPACVHTLFLQPLPMQMHVVVTSKYIFWVQLFYLVKA